MPYPPAIVLASGLALSTTGENVPAVGRAHCDLPGERDWGVRCPQSELRQVAIGLLGPDATSIEVSMPGHHFTVTPYGREGAYLIVLPAQPDANPEIPRIAPPILRPGGGTTRAAGAGLRARSAEAARAYHELLRGGYWNGHGNVSGAPGGAVLTVTYRDGSRCEIPPRAPAQQCRAQGAAPQEGPLLTSAQLSTPVQARYVPFAAHPESPLAMDARGGMHSFARASLPGRGGREPARRAIVVSFVARVPVRSAASGYDVELRPAPVPGCATPEVIVGQPSDRTLAAGSRLTFTVPLEAGCATTYSGRVFFARTSGGAGLSGGGYSAGEGPLYEVIAEQFGPVGSGRNPMIFPTVGRFEISVP